MAQSYPCCLNWLPRDENKPVLGRGFPAHAKPGLAWAGRKQGLPWSYGERGVEKDWRFHCFSGRRENPGECIHCPKQDRNSNRCGIPDSLLGVEAGGRRLGFQGNCQRPPLRLLLLHVLRAVSSGALAVFKCSLLSNHSFSCCILACPVQMHHTGA